RVIVERFDQLYGSDQPRTLFEQRRTEIAMIEHLAFLRLASAITHSVVDGKCALLLFNDHFAVQFECWSVKDALFRNAVHNGSFFAVRPFDSHLCIPAWGVGDLSVQRQHHAALLSGIAREFVVARMSAEFKSASAHPLIKALQPSE